MVSAPVVARERGIVVEEVKRENAARRLRELHPHRRGSRSDMTRDAWRAPSSRTASRASTEIRGIKVDAEFAPHMIYVRNDDKPGFIGRFGTLLGECRRQHRHLRARARQPGRRRDLLRVRGRGGLRRAAAPDRGHPRRSSAPAPCGSDGSPARHGTVACRRRRVRSIPAPERHEDGMGLRFLVVEGNTRGARETHRAAYGRTPSESYAAVLAAHRARSRLRHRAAGRRGREPARPRGPCRL